MTIKQYNFAASEAVDYADIDAYVSDIALSSVWDDKEDAEIPDERISDLCQIWEAAHRTFKQILSDAEMTQVRFSERFLIPLRTAESWSAGDRECNIYLRLMFQQLLGLLTIKIV